MCISQLCTMLLISKVNRAPSPHVIYTVLVFFQQNDGCHIPFKIVLDLNSKTSQSVVTLAKIASSCLVMNFS